MRTDNILKFLGNHGFDKENLELIKNEKEMLLSLIKTISWTNQLASIEYLYCDKFIPQAELVDKDIVSQIESLEEEYELKVSYGNEAYYETVRFGYIAMYHKLENCRKELISSLLPTYNIGEKEFKKLFETQYNESFDKPNSGIVYKFSWISDCTKHQNAIASRRNNAPNEYINYPKDRKLEIEMSTFKKDAIELRSHFKVLTFQVIMLLIINE